VECSDKKTLAIYGAGGLGREVLELAKIVDKWNEIVFIDDINPDRIVSGMQVYDFEKVVSLYKNAEIEFIIGVGEPNVRKILFDKVKSHNYAFTTLIHPSVFISESTIIGEGCVISENAFISCDIKIERNVYLQPMASIGHDTEISNHCVISTFATLAGECKIGECTYIAMSVPVKEKISIGSGSVIGMGSVVLRDIPDNVVAMGNPARAMKMNETGKVFT
jgi:sugar O-acyltransferase (sialic acid O-acetyltransferase NeuD family)